MHSDVERVVALGASNLTRGFQTVVSTARSAWGRDVEIVAALGHGRSYGVDSRFVVRTLPGILQCGLWRHLESRRAAPTRALVTDIGNDILYGFSAAQTLAWTAEAVDRLQRFTSDIILTGLPLFGIRGLSRAKFLAFRSLIVPSCRLSLREILHASEQVEDGLEALAASRDIRFFPLSSDWYGFDPIHIRPSQWRPAWQEILGAGSGMSPGGGRREGLGLYFAPPERQWLLGKEQYTPQTGTRLDSGGQLWLY